VKQANRWLDAIKLGEKEKTNDQREPEVPDSESPSTLSNKKTDAYRKKDKPKSRTGRGKNEGGSKRKPDIFSTLRSSRQKDKKVRERVRRRASHKQNRGEKRVEPSAFALAGGVAVKGLPGFYF